MRAFAGLLLVPFGFVLAIFAGSIILTLSAFSGFIDLDQIGWLGGFAVVSAYRLGMLGAIPVLLAVAVATWFRIGSPLYWLAVWLAMALAAQALPWFAFGELRWRLVTWGIAGLVSGSVYWLVAGRGLSRLVPGRA